MSLRKSYRVTTPHALASAVLVIWGCSKESEPQDPGSIPIESSGGTGGSGGSAAQNGTGGSSAQSSTGGTLPATGGSSATGGGATGGSAATGGVGGTVATGGVGGTVATGGSNAAGGSTPMAGRSASGGVNATGGVSSVGGNGSGGTTTAGGSASGGASATGGVSSVGGNASGGSATAAGGMGGGMGMAGIPNDPNWKPPDMTATAKIVVLYHPEQTAAMSQNVSMTLTLKNQTTAAYDLSKVTIRYWMSSEPAPSPQPDYSYAGLKLAGAPKFVGNMSNSYLEFSFMAGGTVPAYVDQNSLNMAELKGRVETTTQNAHFDQSNDWSFDGTATSGAKPNPKITLYDGTTLIWGCEPSHLCADTSMSGDAGASGM